MPGVDLYRHNHRRSLGQNYPTLPTLTVGATLVVAQCFPLTSLGTHKGRPYNPKGNVGMIRLFRPACRPNLGSVESPWSLGKETCC